VNGKCRTRRDGEPAGLEEEGGDEGELRIKSQNIVFASIYVVQFGYVLT